MPIRREVIAILAGAVVAAAGCKNDKSAAGSSDGR